MLVCPKPAVWAAAHQRLKEYARKRRCSPPSPPKPLILAGWHFTNDIDKRRRWDETVTWATDNGCRELIIDLSDLDFYFVASPSTAAVGPLGGPLYRRWNFEAQPRPATADLNRWIELLRTNWCQIAGEELAQLTRPVAFAGKKARRLVVQADSRERPPWGTWSQRRTDEASKASFRRLRAAVNSSIAPHEVDHIDFLEQWEIAPA